MAAAAACQICLLLLLLLFLDLNPKKKYLGGALHGSEHAGHLNVRPYLPPDERDRHAYNSI
jgi:hypothetical protein